MKILCLVALCLVAVQAIPYPDELIKLEPETIVKVLEDAQPAVAPTQKTKKTKTYSQGSAADRTRLLTDLFKGYNKNVNPDDAKLEFGVNLLDFHICEKRSVLDSYVWLKETWTDQRLTWNPDEYGGTEVIRLDADQIWKPDVTLYNSADPVNMINCWHSNVLIYNTGKVLWVPPCKMTSSCSLNLRKEPYGENTCTLKFGSWTFDGYTLDIQFYNQTAAVDLSELHNLDTSGFEITKNVAQRNEKFYSCCEEPYPDLTFNLTLKRVPGEELFKRLP